MEKKKGQPRILQYAKISFKTKGEILSQTNKNWGTLANRAALARNVQRNSLDRMNYITFWKRQNYGDNKWSVLWVFWFGLGFLPEFQVKGVCGTQDF